ncbi:hypothetical protein ACOSQ2_020243 [Xanthoceras sorbifolium]
MSHQNSGSRGRSSRPNSQFPRRNSHVGASKPSAGESFGSPDGKSQGRGRYSHHASHGSGSKHFNDKHTSNLVYQPKKPDVLSNSVEAEGSHKKQPESQDAVASGGDHQSSSVHSDSQNIHWGVSKMNIAETPQKEAESSATKNIDYLRKEEVTCMQEESPQPLKVDTKGQTSLEKGFDICPPKKGTPFMLKPSLLEKNRQKRNEIKRVMEGQIRNVLRSGMVLLKNYLSISDQVNIVKTCRDLGLGPGGFYQPGYRDGASLNLKMMCLGKNWDPEKRAYEDIRSRDSAIPPTIPAKFNQLVKKAIEDSRALIEGNKKTRDAASELPWMSPDICIVNFYSASGKLGLHQDRDETRESLDEGLPVVSFSVGDNAEFLYGDQRDVDKAQKVLLESGDVLIFGGKSRHIFHGVAAIIPNTTPQALQEETYFRPGRLNLTFRQY